MCRYFITRVYYLETSRPLRVSIWIEDTREDIQGWEVPKARLICFYKLALVLTAAEDMHACYLLVFCSVAGEVWEKQPVGREYEG